MGLMMENKVWFEVQKNIGVDHDTWVNVHEYGGSDNSYETAVEYANSQIKFFNDSKIKFRIMKFDLAKSEVWKTPS